MTNQGNQPASPQGSGNTPSTNPSAGASATGPVVLKALSKWAALGLDLQDPGFSKLHAKESKFPSNRTKYDLSPEKFENYKNDLIQKINRMHSTTTMNADNDNGNTCYILK
jgi:hypothetical protein